MDQLAAGGPKQMGLEEVRRVAPFIFKDAEGVPTQTLCDCVVALNSLPDREIPSPHSDYGHLNFKTLTLFPKDRGNRKTLMRRIASAVVGEFDVLGCKGIRAREEVLGQYGLHQSQRAFKVRIDGSRAKRREEMDGALVWAPTYPATMSPSEPCSRIVVLTPGNFVKGGDLSTLGERTSVMWFGHQYVDGGDLYPSFATGGEWEFGNKELVTDREDFIAAMTEAFGDPRSPILFED